MRLPLVFLLALLALPWPAPAAAPAAEKTLANGLRVIVQPDHRAPVVMVQAWYKVGSAHEMPGKTGISHVLEHMMFKGTRDVGPGEFSRIVSRFGGEQNAFTTAHYTGYYQYLDRARLPLALALEADRMRNLLITPEEFRKEIDVVREERRMRVEDNPLSLAWERFRPVALPGNPAGQPVIGWPGDLDSITVDDLRAWYDTWYAPNNAILVVVGDVKPAEVFAEAERHFGALKTRRLPQLPPPRTAAQPGLREMTLKLPVSVPTLAMAWNVPSLGTAADAGDAWALTVLAAVLDGGMSARFERELVRRDKVAVSAGAGYDLFERGDSLFTVTAVPAGKRTLAELRRAVRAQVEALAKNPPTDAELARVKAQVLAGMVFGQDSLSGQAQWIGSLAAQDYDWRLKDSWDQRIGAVTAADVQRVAGRYLVDDNLTVAEVLPGGSLPAGPAATAPAATTAAAPAAPAKQKEGR